MAQATEALSVTSPASFLQKVSRWGLHRRRQKSANPMCNNGFSVLPCGP